MPPRRRQPVKGGNRRLLLALALGGVLAIGLVAGAVLLTDDGSSEAEPTATANHARGGASTKLSAPNAPTPARLAATFHV